MNNCLVALLMLGISLTSISQLHAAAEDPFSDNERRREIIDKLAQGMTENGKSQMNYAIALLPTEQLHAFEYTVNILTQRMWDFEKGRAVFSLIDMFQKNFDETSNAFTDMTLQQLDKLVSPREIDKLITVLSKMEPNLWQAEITQLINKHKDKFETMVNDLIQGVGVDEYYKPSVMSALARISASRLGAIGQIAYELTQKMTQDNKANVICILAEVPVERLNGLKTTVDSFTQGMRENDRGESITALAEMFVYRSAAFINAFTNEILQLLQQYVPEYERARLITWSLPHMQPDQWQPEITRIINEYRHGNAAQPWVNPTEIHNYANTQITTSSSSRSPSPMRLDDAVMENMNERLQAGNVPSMAYAEARMLLEQWIEAKYSNSSASSSELKNAKEAAFAKLVSDTDYEQVISTAVSFLRKFHPGKEGLWLDGFLGESIKANSCNKGIKERVATGMRTIDTELDRLFAGAEGNLTFSIYCNNWNLSDKSHALKNLRWVADKLYAKGVTAGTSAEKVAEAVEALIAEDLSTSSHENTNTAKGLALDASGAHLEEIKEQFSLIEERALKAEQDTEYEASITAERAEVSTRLSKEEERAARIKVMEKKPT